jgi:hypothetical protein
LSIKEFRPRSIDLPGKFLLRRRIKTPKECLMTGIEMSKVSLIKLSRHAISSTGKKLLPLEELSEL